MALNDIIVPKEAVVGVLSEVVLTPAEIGASASEPADDIFRVVGSADATKKVAFEVDGITTGTTRTLTAPDASGTIARTEDFAAPPAIGSTTPNSGAFTSLSANNGTLTASAPVLDLSQTWNNAAVTFTGLLANFTNTASGSASKALDIKINGTSVVETSRIGATIVRRLGANTYTNAFEVRRDGSVVFSVRDDGIISTPNSYLDSALSFQLSSATGLKLRNIGPLQWASGSNINAATDLVLLRDGANTLAQRSTTNPQTFRLYTTYGGTGGADFERLFIKGQTVGAFQIGTEKGGTGGARALEFQTDSVARLTLGDAGGVTVNSGNLVLTDNTGAETATFDAQAKLTDNRTYDLPDSSGTIALTAQLTDTQIFTAGGTWTKPAGAKMVHYIVIGGGGGGGSGRCDNAGTDRSGGGGGGAGGITVGWLNASALGATETITVGAGGAGGAAKTTVSHGEAGTSGGVSSIGTVIQTHASGGGGGGTTTSGGGGGGASNSARIYSADGATNAGVNGSSGSRGQPSAIFNAPTGGQGGSGISSANVVSASAAAANSGHVRTGALVAGGTGGASAAGGNGNSGGMNFVGTGGGGGSPNSSTGAGNAGGNGGLYGGGGGGGSAGAFSEASGAGGNGADGIVVITTYF
jgi:hypothetical protein